MVSLNNTWNRNKHDCILTALHVYITVSSMLRMMSWIEPLLSGKTAAVWSSCLWSCLNVANHRSFNNQQWFPALCESLEECELMLRHVGSLIYASFIRSWEEFQVITRAYLSITHMILKGSVSNCEETEVFCFMEVCCENNAVQWKNALIHLVSGTLDL